ncbi:MAG: hypothetical protein KAS72_01625 [Phycisphaerales bacterium]|nr:hypothetical protein [Phycisphaerales bacterium]
MTTTHLTHRLAVALVAAAALAPAGLLAGDATLPIQEIALFRSGVGYFHRQGIVEGDAAIQLSFKADQINDILKSMVVFDLDGGRVDSVGYASKEPLARRLAGFGMDLSESPTVPDILEQLRGVPVTLHLPDRTVTGPVFGVEGRKTPGQDGAEAFTQIFVTIATEAGLASVPILKVDRFEILDNALAGELSKALAALAESRDPDKRQVVIGLSGTGEREIIAGYITEMPVWKMTYRLVLDDGDDAHMQGWAIIENTTDEDWTDVDLSLVSGQPVSFVMELYEPVFMHRPRVELDLIALLEAPVYDAEMRGESNSFGQLPADAALARAPMLRRSGGRAMAKGQTNYLGEAISGAVAAATAGVEGEQFFYRLDNPVNLPRRQSAMVPILNQSLAAKRISIYNQGVLANHPMRGVEVTNETGLALMPGPVTVFDGNLYAGDARLPRVAEGDDRIISYAVDLDVEVKHDVKSTTDVTAIKIVRGVLEETRRLQRRNTYDLTNHGRADRAVIVEHPRQADWDLTTPKKPAATTANHYRFEVGLAGGAGELLTVIEHRTLRETTAILHRGVDELMQLTLRGPVGPKVKAALEEIIRQRHEIARIAQQRSGVEEMLREISRDQSRIRDNIGRIDRDSELYRRYMTKLSDQETQIEDLQQQAKQLEQREAELEGALQVHVMNLSVSE